MRRRGVVVFGQDRVRRHVLSSPGDWVVLLSQDCPERLAAKMSALGCVTHRLAGVSGADLGLALGSRAVNVVAFPASDPMGRSIWGLLKGESDGLEQDKGI